MTEGMLNTGGFVYCLGGVFWCWWV